MGGRQGSCIRRSYLPCLVFCSAGELQSALSELRQVALPSVQSEVISLAQAADTACREALQRVHTRVEDIVRMDRQLASLGPDGLDGLCRDMQKVGSLYGIHGTCLHVGWEETRSTFEYARASRADKHGGGLG